MLERILIPLDGSELAESILYHLRPVLTHRDPEILILRVVTLPPSAEGDGGEALDLPWSRASEYVQDVSGRLSSQGVRVRVKVVEGFATEQILAVAQQEAATLIAMSTHGRTGLARWMFGSVTEKILQASPVPVLAVPSFLGRGGDAFTPGARELPFKRILIPIAAEDLSLDIVKPLLEVARLFGSQVTLVHVCEGSECAVPVHQMRQAFQLLRKAGVSAEPVMKQGDAALRILETCREHGADLIAMTTHGHSGVTRWVLGSVAEKLLRAAQVPLLVVRPAKALRASRPKARAEPLVKVHSDP